MVANKTGLYIVDPDRKGAAPSKPKDAKDIIEVLKKLTPRNAGSMVTKMENGVAGFMNMLDFAKRMAK